VVIPPRICELTESTLPDLSNFCCLPRQSRGISPTD